MSQLQPTIRVDVACYNEEEREKLLKYPMATAMNSVVTNGIEVPTAEFLTYYLFHRKRLPWKEHLEGPGLCGDSRKATVARDTFTPPWPTDVRTGCAAVREFQEGTARSNKRPQ